jgi:hypothetical protein
MAISTVEKKEKPSDKKENLKKLREFHKSTFDKLGVSLDYLTGKMAYRPYGKAQIYVSFFDNEINQGHDIYLEFTNRDFVPETTDRTLYLWKFNPHFEEEYEKAEGKDGKNDRYLVPADELKIVKVSSDKDDTKISGIELNFDLPDPSIDPPINELTVRDLAAILMQKPVSNKQWLNDLIKK